MEPVHNTLNELFKTSNHNNGTSNNDYFTCEICRDRVPLNQKFRNMEASGCFHPFCTDCVAKFIEMKVIHDNMLIIKCPNTSCSVLMDALSCPSILPKKVFEKWRRVLCESTVLLDASKGGFVHGRCSCPNRKCSELVLNECVETKFLVKRSECPNCKVVFCFSCMVPWKENHRCRQTNDTAIDIDMDRNDVLFMEMIKRKKWVRCPNCNICVQNVQKGDYYCCRIYCRCGREFCYDCREWPCVCKEERLTCWARLTCLLVFAVFIGIFLLVDFLVSRMIISLYWDIAYLTTPSGK